MTVKFDVVRMENPLFADKVQNLYIPEHAHDLPLKRLYAVKVTSLNVGKCTPYERDIWFMFGEFGGESSTQKEGEGA